MVSLLSLDISKAFDRVSHERLLHNLCKRRISTEIVNWVRSFLGDRRTSIRIGDYTSAEEEVQVGIPQGSPLSPILYLFYSAELVEGCQKACERASATAFVDDTNIVVYGDSDIANCRALERVHRVCERWAAKHGSSFNVSKYQLLHMAKKRAKLDAEVKIGNITVKPSLTLKLLGVHLDKTLSGRAQLQAVQDKAPTLIAALKTLSGSNWGASLTQCKQIYCQAVRPALTYGAMAWFRPANVLNASKGMAEKLQAIQGRCLRVVAGAYKATATEALEAEVGVEPLDLYLKTTTARAVARSALSEKRERRSRGG